MKKDFCHNMSFDRRGPVCPARKGRSKRQSGDPYPAKARDFRLALRLFFAYKGDGRIHSQNGFPSNPDIRIPPQ
jgi:hypothetical protein